MGLIPTLRISVPVSRKAKYRTGPPPRKCGLSRPQLTGKGVIRFVSQQVDGLAVLMPVSGLPLGLARARATQHQAESSSISHSKLSGYQAAV